MSLKKTKLSRRAWQVLQALEEVWEQSPSLLTQDVVADKAGVSVPTASRALNELRDRSFVSGTRGTWALKPAGQRYLQQYSQTQPAA